jgi:hypothetical protein
MTISLKDFALRIQKGSKISLTQVISLLGRHLVNFATVENSAKNLKEALILIYNQGIKG